MYREWSTDWLGQSIAVKVWYHNDLFLRLTEELWIGGLLVDRNRIRSWYPVFICERLAAPVGIAERVHHIEVAISYQNNKPCCNIYGDGEIIGGNIDLQIPRSDVTAWPEIRRRGFRHFLFEAAYFNILRLARAFASTILIFSTLPVLFHFMGKVPFNWEFTLSFILQCIAIVVPGIFLGSLAISFSYWRMYEKLYAQTLAHQRKLDLPPVCWESGKQEVC